VYASGKLFPENGYKVFSKIPGYLEKYHVSVGDTVRTGQPLVTLKSEVSSLNVEAARNLMELARKNADKSSPLLQSLQQEVKSAGSKYKLDSANYSRFQALFKEQATSQVQLDQAKTQFEISSNAYQKAKSTYQSTLERLETEYRNARIQYEAQQSSNNEYTLVSAVSGMVYDLIPKTGELIQPSALVLEIGSRNKYYAEINVDETDVSYLNTEQKVYLKIDAFPDKMLEGRITEIFPRISGASRTSKVYASVTIPSDMKIFSGMSLEANIIIEEKKNVLTIPRDFLLGKEKVITSSGDTLLVKTGVKDLTRVEIVSGIDAETEIQKPK
jgi:HlyD family secretion protein